ncbi:hypothetical protein tpqmel_0569 [Candidatus Gastranaerophilus sp. (ex Termes propinquus)]|nr:hypothetical protein tpqmel_0569 [Candidatus Gastranaerophilus sp. (ex Termes propinquus)]
MEEKENLEEKAMSEDVAVAGVASNIEANQVADKMAEVDLKEAGEEILEAEESDEKSQTSKTRQRT